MFTRAKLKLEAAIPHTTSKNKNIAAGIQLARAEKLSPHTGDPSSPLFKRRQLLAQRAADKAETLIRSNKLSRKDFKRSLRTSRVLSKQYKNLHIGQQKNRMQLYPGVLMPPGGLE